MKLRGIPGIAGPPSIPSAATSVRQRTDRADAARYRGSMPASPRTPGRKNTQMTPTLRILASSAAIALAAGTFGCASTATHESTGQYVDDTAITGKVKTAIFNEPTLKSAEINVETFKGVVQLGGFVSSSADQDLAVKVAHNVPGVKSVKDDMRLK